MKFNKYVAVAAIWVATAVLGFLNHNIDSWIGWSVGATALVLFFG